MRLSAKILKNVSGVNHFHYDDQAYLVEGSSNEIYIQLVDLDKKLYPAKDSTALPDCPLRYIPNQAATLEMEFDSLYDDEKFTVNAINPFPEDKSIWKVSMSDEQIPNSGNLIIHLTENGNTKRAVIRSAIYVELSEIGGC